MIDFTLLKGIFVLGSLSMSILCLYFRMNAYDPEFLHRIYIVMIILDVICLLLSFTMFSRFLWMVILYLDYKKLKNNIDENTI